jgi:tetratricopeptide (TPR) repeat protein
MSIEIPCKEDYAQATSAFIQEDYSKALEFYKKSLTLINEIQLDEPEKTSLYEPFAQKLRSYIADMSFELGFFSEARENYLVIKSLPQAAYTLIFEEKLDEALDLYHLCPYSPAAKWGVFLCQLLKDEISIFNPGYLSYRLFLETTATYFIRFKLNKYLESLIIASKDIEAVFPEYLKCLGSAYLACEDYPAAILILEEALKGCDFDAEIFYKLAQCYMLTNNYAKAKESFKRTLKFLPNHISTLKYLGNIK